MSNKVKKILKRFLPAPSRTYDARTEETLQKINDIQNSLLAINKQTSENNAESISNEAAQYKRLENAIAVLEKKLEQMQEDMNNSHGNKLVMLEQINNMALDYGEKIDSLTKIASETRERARETLWAEIFNNTIYQSSWLYDKTFSPGRWAVGYPYLYNMYRVLNEAKPKCILEMGLGQSTRMISQYASAYPDVKHIVAEQDKEWIKFYINSYSEGKNTQIVHAPVCEVSFLGDDNVLVYKDFMELFGNRTYDFISIDGPGISRASLYARVDVLKLIPQNISDAFCVLIDDTDHKRGKNLFNLMRAKFKECGIEIAGKEFHGDKSMGIVSSMNQKFLCSM